MLISPVALLQIKGPLGSQVWQCTPVILALRRWREEDLEFEAKLGHIGRS
jgi:hypothetical protein